MRTKFIPALIGFSIIGATGGIAYWSEFNMSKASATILEQSGDATEARYSLAEVAAHNSAADCWAIINSGVYDLTTWIPRHPGGERAIEGLCGTDGSAAFNAQHGDGAAQQAILADLKVGVIE